MIEKQDLPESLKNAYMFANTPTYLFRKLYQDSFVEILQHCSNEQLEHYISIANPEDSSSIILAYASLMASLKKGIKINNTENVTAFEKLAWARSIAALYQQTVVGESVLNVAIPKTATTIPSTTSTNESFINMDTKHV
ncbi:MAG: hypothetical protein QM709_15730 [Spongiibacteraceae bacterium]